MQTSQGQSGSAHVVVLGNEKGGSGKSTTALHIAVAQHDDMCRTGLTLTSLHQHDSTPIDIFKSGAAAVKRNAR